MSLFSPRAALETAEAAPAPVVRRPSDDCVTEIRWGVITGGAFLVLLLGWGAATPLDSAAHATGQITVSGHRQSVQYKEVGLVSAIRVHEGQKVRAGDVLLEVSGGEIRAQERALAGQVMTLQAQRARLEAEQLALPAIVWPAELTHPSAEDTEQAAKAMAVQSAQFATRRASLGSQKAVVLKKVAELGEQIEGYRRQIEAGETQNRLLGEELQGVQSLAAEGYAPQSRVRNLQRNQAEISGQHGQYRAAIAQSEQMKDEARLQVVQLEKQRAEEIVSQLKDTQFQLGDLEPKWFAAREQVRRQQIRAPISGAVIGLKVTTIGGVIAPGDRLMDIVPDKAELVVEARLPPSDADDIHTGAVVEVKIPAIHDRQLRTTRAVLTKLSPDSVVDERTGASYFLAEATLTPESLAALRKAEQGQFELKPGLPAEVLIPRRKRTALQYLMDPITDAVWRAFRER
ncbi:MAG: HlyD family type I secretion periplasmic adaptor subunit [Caulobacteraceae bacterium]